MHVRYWSVVTQKLSRLHLVFSKLIQVNQLASHLRRELSSKNNSLTAELAEVKFIFVQLGSNDTELFIIFLVKIISNAHSYK